MYVAKHYRHIRKEEPIAWGHARLVNDEVIREKHGCEVLDFKEWREPLNLNLDSALTHQQLILLLSLSKVINLRMLWSCKEVLRVMRLHYTKIRYQFEIHQSMNSFLENIRMTFLIVIQNAHKKGSSEWNLRIVLSTARSW